MLSQAKLAQNQFSPIEGLRNLVNQAILSDHGSDPGIHELSLFGGDLSRQEDWLADVGLCLLRIERCFQGEIEQDIRFLADELGRDSLVLSDVVAKLHTTVERLELSRRDTAVAGNLTSASIANSLKDLAQQRSWSEIEISENEGGTVVRLTNPRGHALRVCLNASGTAMVIDPFFAGTRWRVVSSTSNEIWTLLEHLPQPPRLVAPHGHQPPSGRSDSWFELTMRAACQSQKLPFGTQLVLGGNASGAQNTLTFVSESELRTYHGEWRLRRFSVDLAARKISRSGGTARSFELSLIDKT